VVTVRVPLPARGGDSSYDILIDHGLLARLPALLAEYCPAAAYAVVSDSQVGPRYGEPLVTRLREAGQEAALFTFPAGERHKTRETWAAVSDRLVDAQVGRDGALIALGGGVVGDVAGFVAATYLRGIPYIQVPTSLLAMIDSSVGGKTGVDVAQGKNLVGAFHQPRLVVTDLDTLATLPRAQLASGMAEAVKHGVVADAEYFALLERDCRAALAGDAETLERVVARSVSIKSEVVAADERDAGRRAILNFGHTVGHAIEATGGYAGLHGEAVAVGLKLEAELAERAGIAEPGIAARVARLLSQCSLPLALPVRSVVDALLGAMRHDKKSRGGELRLALPRRIGAMAGGGDGWTVCVAESLMRSVLTAPGSF
jgi:3-dehydroquinate synthase